MGCVPVSCACWAMRTDGSRTIEDGFGRRDARFWIAEARRSAAGREVGCADIVRLLSLGAAWD